MDSRNNLYDFQVWAPKTCSPYQVHDIDALAWQVKLLSPIFLGVKVRLLNKMNMDSYNNLQSFHDQALQTLFPYWDNDIDALFW